MRWQRKNSTLFEAIAERTRGLVNLLLRTADRIRTRAWLQILCRPRTVLALLFFVVGLEAAALQVYVRLDSIVHIDLYQYGLQFDEAWALDYWNSFRIVWGSLLGSVMLMGITLIPYHLYSHDSSLSSRWSCILFPLVAIGFATVSMYFIYHIDSIVHGTLYEYGLQFSPEWAVGYWNIVRATLGLIGASVALQVVMALSTWLLTREE